MFISPRFQASPRSVRVLIMRRRQTRTERGRKSSKRPGNEAICAYAAAPERFSMNGGAARAGRLAYLARVMWPAGAPGVKRSIDNGL